jgi:hypothetical protein
LFKPLAALGKCVYPGLAEAGADRLAAERLAGEILPQQSDGAFIAELGNQLGQGEAAHPHDPLGAVAVTQHCLRGDQPRKPAIHRPILRPASCRRSEASAA